MVPHPGRLVRRLVPMVALSLLVATCTGTSDSGAPSAPNGGAKGSSGTGGNLGTANVAFYYQPIDNSRVLDVLGDVQAVVTVPQADERAAVDAIHKVGAKAYKYVQAYWWPVGRSYEGVDMAKHPHWAFCEQGAQPMVGRTTATGVHWLLVDANEREVQDHFRKYIQHHVDAGWDGVMFDRGRAAFFNGHAADGTPISYRTSTCTDDPVEPGLTFSDAYLRLVEIADKSRLDVMLNYGKSPFDPAPRMRPDPRDASCHIGAWDRCRILDDVWANADLVLDEAVAHPQDVDWAIDYEANRQNEQNARFGGRVVGLITQGTLGVHSRFNVYFQWARVKLFDFPLAVNTGNDDCPGATSTDPCNRQAAYPELASARLGPPVDHEPVAFACTAGSNVHCLWVRHYERGMALVNVSPDTKATGRLPLEVDGCRHVRDLFANASVGNGACVQKVEMELPPWSGRPLVYAEDRSGQP